MNGQYRGIQNRNFHGNTGNRNNPTHKSNKATAPYNFVPWVEKVFFPNYEVRHDRAVGGLDGEIELEIETLTPMFIRDGQKLDDYCKDSGGGINANFFCAAEQKPVIPGSSLRGMVRTLVEILSYSKMTQVTNEHLFYRSVGNDRVGKHYCEQFVKTCGRVNSGVNWKTTRSQNIAANVYQVAVKAGFVRKNGKTWFIEECGFARVDHDDIKYGLGLDVYNQNGKPQPALRNKDVFVKVDAKEKDYFFPDNRRHGNMYLRLRKVHAISAHQSVNTPASGKLVITGNIPNTKHMEFVFFPSEKLENSERYKITEEKLKRFNDDDQITQWQKDVYSNDGKLCDGDPVFFLTEKDNKTVEFFGRAQLFRLPYDLSPFDLVPGALRNEPYDLSELLFGTVSQDDTKKAVKGRVYFGDAKVTVEPKEGFYEELGNPIIPHILASPKPTCVSHYLEQKPGTDNRNLFSYISSDKNSTKIRGHKLYWHRWDDSKNIRQIVAQGVPANSTQHTRMKVLTKGVHFKAVIRFNNLHAMELGALLTALKLPNGCAHKIGMGKPLGLGSIKINHKLRIYEHDKRYGSFSESGLAETNGDEYLSAFEQSIVEHAKSISKEKSNISSLTDIERLKSLYKILNWNSRPASNKTEYLELRAFRDKAILPQPANV